MAINKINVPNIGEDTLEVTEILVKTGDNININQPLIIIEGDKSSVEIPSTYTGVINKIHINVGDKVRTGTLILSINTNIESINNKKSGLQYNTNTSNALEINVTRNFIDPTRKY